MLFNIRLSNALLLLLHMGTMLVKQEPLTTVETSLLRIFTVAKKTKLILPPFQAEDAK